MTFKTFDGTVGADNSDATSYGSVAGLLSYADMRGKVLPSDTKSREILLTLAMDWIEAKGEGFAGLRSDDAQPLCFPRTGLYLNNSTTMFDDTQLPNALLNGQYELACIIAKGVDLYPVAEGSFVKSEKVDVIEIVYSETVRNSGLPDLPSVEAFLGPLMDGGGLRLMTVRG